MGKKVKIKKHSFPVKRFFYLKQEFADLQHFLKYKSTESIRKVKLSNINITW